jgi:hypothetical protein
MLTLGEKKAKQAYHVTFFKGWMAGWMASPAFRLRQHPRNRHSMADPCFL